MNMNLHPDKKRAIHQVLALCTTALLTLATASCEGDSALQQPLAEGTASLTLRIEVPAATRVGNFTDEEYATLENRINTLRVLIVSESGSVLKNETFTADELAATSGSYTHTVSNLPVGTVNLYLVANEASIGKDYNDTDKFTGDMVDAPSPSDPGTTIKKVLITDEEREHFPKRYSQLTSQTDALPMSAHTSGITINPGENEASLSLIRSVAKLKIEMVNELTRTITVNEMSFGAFMADRFYLFQEEKLDVPSDAGYAGIKYGNQDDASQHLGIEIEGGATRVLVLYIYPSYAWTSGTGSSPYTIGFRTPNATYDALPFTNTSNPFNSIARNTQVTIRALLHTDSNFTLNFEVESWATETIEVPSFD